MQNRSTTKTTIKNGDVTIPITRTGEGQEIIFFNGGGATQISWKQVISQLKGKYDVITFDFRGHGKASFSDDHTIKAFLSDTEKVMDAIGADKPIVVGWSMGADLALAYAATHKGKLGGLILIDGAVPLSEPLVEDETQLRRSLNSPIMKISKLFIRFTPYWYSLPLNAIGDITIELDSRRQQLVLDSYAKVDCPIEMILATKSAGEKTDHAKRNNKLWREGSERLAARYPSISIKWLDGTHQLPFTKSAELAEMIDGFTKEHAFESHVLVTKQ